MQNSLDTRTEMSIQGKTYVMHDLSSLNGVNRLPYSLKILLENLLRYEDGISITSADIEALLTWDSQAEPSKEIAFRPARVLMQDFTGVPAVVDLAAMRDAMCRLKGDPEKINPLQPAELVIDHSVQVDRFGSDDAFNLNAELEYNRNRERYAFLKWGQKAFSNFKVIPPDTGIVHQVNLEYLARVVFSRPLEDGKLELYPDTVVGTDSHTTMINGLGVLGWGVGGIEAEAAMLGQPISMLVPQVVGFELTGNLPEGATATDLVLTVVEMLRAKGVVGKFVEFYGEGLRHLPLADRATISNMAPEYGATCGIFPIDEETLNYLKLTGRSANQIALTETYARAQGLFYEPGSPVADYTDIITLDLSTVEPSLAGPKRPQDRIPLSKARSTIGMALEDVMRARMAAFTTRRDSENYEAEGGHAAVGVEHQAEDPARRSAMRMHLKDGMVVIAAITSCTNTSNPSVMIAAGLLAKKARESGLHVQPWVKTSLAPGSRVVTAYLDKSNLSEDLSALGFDLVGYGCTTCIGNSGPLPEPVSEAIRRDDLTVCSVLSGNRNFEGRVHSEVRMNFLASPPLVIAYALAGRMDIDFSHEPIGEDKTGHPVYLRDIWPSQHEIQETILSSVTAEQFSTTYANVYDGEERWRRLEAPDTPLYEWHPDSTYVQSPPYFDNIEEPLLPVDDIKNARVLAYLGDSVTTDHISPAGSIKTDSPAGQYLIEQGVHSSEFNSYGSRRGNHEVMMRGTFANIRLRNFLVPDTEGGYTRHLPSGDEIDIYEAAMRYKAENTPTIIIAGREYGSGSSRDWAAKGPRLLGVKAVLVESFERIHRSNLVGMGILPLQFQAGENAETIGLNGDETFDISGLGNEPVKEVTITASAPDGTSKQFKVKVRIDTPKEFEYYRHGGILPYVLRQLAA